MSSARRFLWIDDAWRDLVYAARLLRRSPGFTAITVLTLALGIGANVAIFSLVNAVMLRPLPVRDAATLVELLFKFPGDPRLNQYSWTDYEHLRDRNHVFSNLMAVSLDRRQLSHDALAPEVVTCMSVGGEFFDVLGIRPAIGRLIGPEHERAGASESAVAVISWSYWQSRFNLDPGILGTSLLIDRVPARIVGVAPRGFFGLQLGIEPPVWLPTAAEPLLHQPSRLSDGTLPVAIFGRLKPGVSLDQATAEVRVLDRPRQERLVERLKDRRFRDVQIEAVPAAAGITLYAPNLRDRFGSALSWTMAAVGVLLVIACVNVASMLLARGAARQREMAVRLALGAGHLRLLRQLLAESVLLATLGGALGVLLAYGAAGALARFLASGRAPVAVPEGLRIDVHIDGPVLLFAAAAATTVGVLVGLVPAWRAIMSSSLASPLRAVGAAAETRSARAFGRGLVVAQVGLSVVLLSAAALFGRYLAQLRTVGVGFESQSVLQVKLDLSRSGRKPEEVMPLYRELVQRMAALPGVRSASFSALTPISGAAGRLFASVDGVLERPEDRRRVSLNNVAPGYFQTLSTPFVSGRDFQAADADGPRVAIINQAMARHYFGAGNPVGRHFTLEGQTRPLEIVGVVADAKYLDLHETPPRTAYTNALQGFGATAPTLLLRSDVPPLSIVPDVRRTVNAVLPNVPLRVQTLREQIDASILPERLIAMLSALFGALAAVLVAIGLFGLLSYMVERRMNEIGIRIALGATSRDIVWMVCAGALPLVAGGFAVGAPIALVAKAYAAKVLTLVAETQAQAPITLAPGVAWPIVAAGGAMIAVALIASFIPARRATKVDPIEALRVE